MQNCKVVYGQTRRRKSRQITARSLRHVGMSALTFFELDYCLAELCVLLATDAGLLAFAVFAAPAPVMEHRAPALPRVCSVPAPVVPVSPAPVHVGIAPMLAVASAVQFVELAAAVHSAPAGSGRMYPASAVERSTTSERRQSSCTSLWRLPCHAWRPDHVAERWRNCVECLSACHHAQTSHNN